MQGDYLITTKDYGRKSNPYGSALLVCEHNDGYFENTIPLEAIPSIFGERETYDFNVLTELAKGVVSGKMEMTAATQAFFLTKENLERLDQLTGKTFTYMVACGNNIGYTFNAEISYKVADIDNGSILQGEMTITPSSFGSVLKEVRPFIRDTLTFTGTVPVSVTLTNEEGKGEYTLKVAVEETKNATIEATVVGDGSNNYTATWASGLLTVKAKEGIVAPSYAQVYLVASSTEKMSTEENAPDKYAPALLIIDLNYVQVTE